MHRIEKAVHSVDHGYFETFTRAENEQLPKLWEQLKDKEIHWPPGDDEARNCMAVRHLRACNHNLKKTVKRIERYSSLRQHYHVDNLTIDDVKDTVRDMGFMFLGINKLGAPTVFFHAKDIKGENLSILEGVLSWVYLLEYIDRLHPKNMAPLVVVVDMKGLKIAKYLTPKMILWGAKTKLTSRNLLNELYPRRFSYVAVYCQASTLYTFLYKLGRMVDTIGKRVDGGKSYRALHVLHEPGQIPRDMGGDSDITVDSFIEQCKEHDQHVLGGPYHVDEVELRKYPKKDRAKFESHEQPQHHSPAVSPA